MMFHALESNMAGLVILFLAVYCTALSGAENGEVRLVKELESRLNKNDAQVRPLLNPSDPLEVKFGISLQGIRGVNLVDEEIELITWENYELNNEFLTWNPEKYDGVQSVRLGPYGMYMPDIVPYNLVAATDPPIRSNAVVYSDGTVSYVPPMNRKVKFTTDDEGLMNVILKVGSWTYDGSKLNVTSRSDEVDLSTYQPHKHYDLIRTEAVRHVMVYECCPEPYVDITFTMVFREK